MCHVWTYLKSQTIIFVFLPLVKKHKLSLDRWYYYYCACRRHSAFTWTRNIRPLTQWNMYSDDELRFMYENGQGHLTLFCIVFVWLRGRPSTVRSPIQDPWFMYQNQLGPSGGIYYPNFVPCFVVLYLNNQKKSERIPLLSATLTRFRRTSWM